MDPWFYSRTRPWIRCMAGCIPIPQKIPYHQAHTVTQHTCAQAHLNTHAHAALALDLLQDAPLDPVHGRLQLNREFSQIENVDVSVNVSVNVDIESHPVGSTTP